MPTSKATGVLAALAACVLILFAAPVRAQTVTVNPTTIEFMPSPDHSAIGLDGTPRVTRYEMRIFIETPLGTTPIQTTDLGKPTPVAGKIAVTNPIWFSGLTPSTRYVAKVAALGPAGEGVSTPSNPFGNEPALGPPTGVLVKK